MSRHPIGERPDPMAEAQAWLDNGGSEAMEEYGGLEIDEIKSPSEVQADVAEKAEQGHDGGDDIVPEL